MFASTPERSRGSISMDRIRKNSTNAATFSLPPLSSMLGDEMVSPVRPTLPGLNSFATPQTPRYLLPTIRSASTPSLAALPELGAKSATTRILAAADEPLTQKRMSLPNVSGLSNVSMDSDADISVNDSMIKPATKRKHGTTSPTRDFAFISHSPATYPSQEPSIDNASLARRKRRRTSPNELAILNSEFKLGSTPDKTRRVDIAAKVNMTEKAVQIWFQNKRQSLRRVKNTDREVTELPPTPDSSVLAAGAPADHSTVPLFASTPLRPALVKSESHHFSRSPAMAQSSPIRSHSTSDLVPCGASLNRDAGVKVSLLSKMLASSTEGGSEKDEKRDDKDGKRDEKDENGEKKDEKFVKRGTESPELVMNLTNKKQPEFARQSAQASTQVRTFKLTPKERKPLGNLNTNLNHPKVHNAKDSQCIQSLLSLKVGHH